MTKLRNKQKIDKIIMKPTAYTKCEIGQDWYRNELEIVFVPGDYYPDYIEVNDWIMQEIDGKEFNIEDVVEAVYDYLNGYNPLVLNVIDHVKNCKTHFDVVVEKR